MGHFLSFSWKKYLGCEWDYQSEQFDKGFGRESQKVLNLIQTDLDKLFGQQA